MREGDQRLDLTRRKRLLPLHHRAEGYRIFGRDWLPPRAEYLLGVPS